MERPPSVIIRQRVSPIKLQRSRELCRRMTKGEAALWEHLRDSRLGFRFRRQQVIAGFVVGFHCHQAGLVVEIDGSVHDGQEAYDEERDKTLAARGVRVLRLRNHEAHSELDRVLDRIASACRETLVSSATD